ETGSLKPDLSRKIWYTADTSAMFADVETGTAPRLPFAVYLESDEVGRPGTWPKGRDAASLINAIPNRHLEYSLTWFGLALTLIAVYGTFLIQNLRETPNTLRDPSAS